MSHGYQKPLDFRRAGRYKPPIPVATRRAVLSRASGCCENCGSRTSAVELHHLHYETEGRETQDDLKALCRDCHNAAHVAPNGEFYVDPQERAAEWATYGEQD